MSSKIFHKSGWFLGLLQSCLHLHNVVQARPTLVHEQRLVLHLLSSEQQLHATNSIHLSLNGGFVIRRGISRSKDFLIHGRETPKAWLKMSRPKSLSCNNFSCKIRFDLRFFAKVWKFYALYGKYESF